MEAVVSLKTAVIIGLVGATVSFAMSLIPALHLWNVYKFLTDSSPWRFLHCVPSVSLLIFFIVVLAKQK